MTSVQTHPPIDAAAPDEGRPPPAAPRPSRRRRSGERWLVHLGLLLVCGGFVLPFAWMVTTSLKTQQETLAFPPTLVPDPPRPQNYWVVLTDPKFDFLLFTRNTLVVTALTVLGTTLSSAVVAYGFARIRFRGRGVLFAVMLATMMIPFPVTMVSGFVIFRWLGDHTPVQFLGTFRPLWLPAWFGSAFNIFLLRQFFVGVPEQLSEAARIDGCSEFGIFWRVILPLAKPALAVVALFSFMGAWNDFLGPLIYLQRREQYTLALGLQAFASQSSGTDFNLLMAASLMVLAPVILLFFLAQQTFVKGIATTGIKG
jgi:multiple sugar transport system permease protein